jgi:hypothetical protein
VEVIAMTTRISRLAAQLDAAVAAAANPLERRSRQAERAMLWARQGKFDAARATVDALKAEAALQPLPLPDAWLMLAEGVLSYYRNLGREAGVQLQAALDAARALADKQADARTVAALAAAWLALPVFAGNDTALVARLLRDAFDLSDAQQHAVRARASLVAAFAYQVAGQVERSQAWLALSRRHAIALGDDTHLSALMHNQAALRVNLARLAHLFGDERSERALAQDLEQALVLIDSVNRYDDGIGNPALRSLVPTLQAQLLTAQGRWADALNVFDAHLERALREGMGYQAPCLYADAAWCAWNLQRLERCEAATAAAEAGLQDDCDADDRAMALARLAQLHAARGDAPKAEQCRQAARGALDEHRAHQQALQTALDGALGHLVPAQLTARA